MGRKERLYERALTRPIDDQARREIEDALIRKRSEIDVPLEIRRTDGGSSFTISSTWASFLVQFGGDRMIVDAELSWAARMFATEENRRHVVRFISDIADDLKL